MERARAIKEKREFAQELEDIQDFEKKVAGGSRKKKGAESSDGGESDNDDDDDDGDEGKPPKKRIVCFFFDPFGDSDGAVPPCRTPEIASMLFSGTKAMRIRYISMIHYALCFSNFTRSTCSCHQMSE